MKFRFPSRRPPVPGAPRPFGRQRLLFYLSSLAVLLLAFLLGFYLFLPLSPLRERIEHEVSRSTGGELRIGRLALRFPLALKAENLVLRGTGVPGGEPLEIASVYLDPLWHTLLGGNPGFAFQARLAEGNLEGAARRDGSLNVRLAQIPFDEAVAKGSAVKIAGIVREGAFTGAFPAKPGTDTRLELLVDRLRVTGLESLGVAGGSLSLGNLTAQGTGKGNNFKIDRLEATGGDMQVSGGGSLLLNQPVDRSRINLQVTLRPAGTIDPNLRGLLDLFANAEGDGSYRLRLSGTLASPVFAK